MIDRFFMTSAGINSAIAEACGWKNVHWYEDNSGPGFWSGIPYISEEDVFKMDARKLDDLRKYGTHIPDYCNDLNAMHEAEKVLNEEQWEFYMRCLVERESMWITSGRKLPDAFKQITHATARQRAEAFIATIGKCKSMTHAPNRVP